MISTFHSPGINPYSGRFAPTPSGSLHLGNLRTALVAYLDATVHEGAFFLRFDDLDSPRVKPGLFEEHLSDLREIGVEFGAPPIHQSQRLQHYLAAFEQLRQIGAIYPCFCSRKQIQDVTGSAAGVYPGTCRVISHVQAAGRIARGDQHCWRFRVEEPVEVLEDSIQGRLEVNLQKNGGDFVILRADGIPGYQLSCAVDDATPGITHVIRGVDLVESAARQQRVLRILGLGSPQYGHLPLLMQEGGGKLSKSLGADDLRAWGAKGYTPPQLRGWLAHSLGWVSQVTPLTMNDLVELYHQHRIKWTKSD
ncbi:MAG: tRNA glutamyl-Q(34) synthetase GluQRS [Candidatus Sumerlaeia bacterium]|nr:tRNA glutamyl-Q(34) synthetase GluQRS [Candidatus Sumerlaeia bacterium]